MASIPVSQQADRDFLEYHSHVFEAFQAWNARSAHLANEIATAQAEKSALDAKILAKGIVARSKLVDEKGGLDGLLSADVTNLGVKRTAGVIMDLVDNGNVSQGDV